MVWFWALGLGVLLGEDAELIKPLGTLFLNAIKMLIVPLVFASLVVGVTSMKDPARMGRIGIKAFVLFLCTTAVAITIGLGFGTVIQPGVGIALDAAAEVAPKTAPSLVDTLVAMVPKNPISALAAGKILQIIVFALLLGISINLVGRKGPSRLRLSSRLRRKIMYKMTQMVMELAPFGVFRPDGLGGRANTGLRSCCRWPRSSWGGLCRLHSACHSDLWWSCWPCLAA